MSLAGGKRLIAEQLRAAVVCLCVCACVTKSVRQKQHAVAPCVIDM